MMGSFTNSGGQDSFTEEVNKNEGSGSGSAHVATTMGEHPVDSWFNNLTNKEELLYRWSEKLRREKYENAGLYNYTNEISLKIPPDPTWAGFYHYGLIALYAIVLITIIVVAIKACVVLFEKTEGSKIEGYKESPSILRMPCRNGTGHIPLSASSTTGATTISSRFNEIPNQSAAASSSYETVRSVSPRSLMLVHQSSTTSSVIPIVRSTSPCCIYNNANCCTAANAAVLTGSGTTSNNHKKLLQTSGRRGVSLESSEVVILNPCGSCCCLHHHHRHHLSQHSVGATASLSSSRNQRKHQYQNQHQQTNESSSFQWDSLNTNTTDHSGESPPSYEIALGVEIASRPQSAGNCSDTEN